MKENKVLQHKLNQIHISKNHTDYRFICHDALWNTRDLRVSCWELTASQCCDDGAEVRIFMLWG